MRVNRSSLQTVMTKHFNLHFGNKFTHVRLLLIQAGLQFLTYEKNSIEGKRATLAKVSAGGGQVEPSQG